MNRVKFARAAMAACGGAAILTAASAASAAVIKETITFDASSFGSGAPDDPVSGSFTLSFDPTLDYTSWTPGVAVNALSIPGLPSTAYFTSVAGSNEDELAISTLGPNPGPADYFELNLSGGSAAVFAGKGSGVLTANNTASYYSTAVGSGFTSHTGTYTVTGVPEPAAWVLMMIGLAGLGGVLRRSRHAGFAR